jgi:LmbE family N-acetylglucosaminyl deacetylase
VDGVERVVVPWPDWAITTVVDTRDVSPAVWRAVQCHTSQLTVTQRAQEFTADEVQGLWGTQYFYRAFSVVNGGRTRETDLFEGLRR